jgi:hypothetical protein
MFCVGMTFFYHFISLFLYYILALVPLPYYRQNKTDCVSIQRETETKCSELIVLVHLSLVM